MGIMGRGGGGGELTNIALSIANEIEDNMKSTYILVNE